MKLIHYGSSSFNPELFYNVTNETFRKKPDGGLWTSPVNSDFGWKEWCKAENFRDCNKDKSFIIEIKTDKLLVINSESDLDKIPFTKTKFPFMLDINFENLAKVYDAIHLTVKGEIETRYSEKFNLYGWDCESVLILNKDCII